MPRLAPKLCSQPGCPNLDCEEHRRPERDEVLKRDSAARRGYGRRWRRLRLMYLRAHPICEEAGCSQAATDVHHRLAKRDGGSDVWDNLQALCHSCHSKRTAAERSRGRGDQISGGKNL